MKFSRQIFTRASARVHFDASTINTGDVGAGKLLDSAGIFFDFDQRFSFLNLKHKKN